MTLSNIIEDMAEEIDQLRDIIKTPPQSKRDCFLKFAALNRLNALVKDEKYKNRVRYWQIKPKVYEQVKAILESGHKDFFDSIYYDEKEKPACIYIVIYGLQFCFHNVQFEGLDDDNKQYIRENSQTWEGIRLQPASEAIYTKALEIQEEDLKEEEVQSIITQLKKNISDGKKSV